MSTQFEGTMSLRGDKEVATMCDAGDGTFVSRDTGIRVFIPICIHPLHWILGDLNLVMMRMVVYDSYRSETLKCQVHEKLLLFREGLKAVFKALRHRIRTELARNMEWVFASSIPQQTGLLGDCGVWVCHFLSDLVTGVTPRGCRTLHSRLLVGGGIWRNSFIG